MASITCCRDCKERHTLCWNECERYKAQRKELDEANRRIRKEKEAYTAYTEMRTTRRLYKDWQNRGIKANKWRGQ